MVLARRAGVPQSTISRIEKGQKDTSIFTLQKILSAISCDLVIAPVLQKPVKTVRLEQAKKITKKRSVYLKGTMNLEKQQPDDRFIQELMHQEEQKLLQGPNAKLWEE